MRDELDLRFTSEVPLTEVAGTDELELINFKGNREKIKIHYLMALDGYLELTKELREYLGLDEKWTGIAFEGQSIYYHSSDEQKDRDRRKKLVLREKNVILLEIWNRWEESDYLQFIINQIEAQTGTKVSQDKFNKLKNYLGQK